MVELASGEGTGYRFSYAGDTFNTATYLSRILGGGGDKGGSVSYVTVIGEDALSLKMKDRFQEEGLGTDLVFTSPNHTVGLYLIDNDERGERSFTYWRDNSAARLLMSEEWERVLRSVLKEFDLIYLSGISLSILPPDGRARLLELLTDAEVPVAFDPNYRAQLWQTRQACRKACDLIAPICRFVLASLDDESAMWDIEDPEAAAQRWRNAGADEIVIKNGAEAVVVLADTCQQYELHSSISNPVDTTGAGDRFNAAYIARRIAGGTVPSAVQGAQMLASRVIMQKGAILADLN